MTEKHSARTVIYLIIIRSPKNTSMPGRCVNGFKQVNIEDTMTDIHNQQNQKTLDETIEMLENAVARNDQKAEAAARVQLGQIYLLDENFSEAAKNFELALSIAQQSGWVSIELQALSGLIQTAAADNQIDQAVAYSEQAISKARQANAQAEEVQAIQTITGILSQNRAFERTIPYLLRGVEIARQKPDPDWELKFLSDLGMAYYLTDDLPNAESTLESAYDHAVRFQKKLEEAILAGRLASVRADMGKIDAAIELNKHALDLAKELNDPLLEAEQLVLLAMNYLEMDAAGEAEGCLQQAKKIYLEQDDIKFLVQVEKLLHEIRRQKNA